MSCYHPLKGFQVGLTQNGKPKYKITSYDIDHVEIEDNGDVVLYDSPGSWSFGKRKIIRDFIQIPCGRCIGCRIDYSRQWADRCMLELDDHESSYFLTLTYDEEHYDKLEHAIDSETGEQLELRSLKKKDIQQFHKDLRRYLDDNEKPKIRFFCCGEYGDRSLRCHFHDIVFGLVLDDKKVYKRSRNGDIYWTSETLNRIWKKGYVVIGQVTYRSAAYVARYVVKKQKGKDSEVYQKYGIEPPFVLMSRRQGIGRKYFDNNPGMFDYRCHHLGTEDGSIDIYPSRYFKKILEFEDPEKYQVMKETNKMIGENLNEIKLSLTDKSYLDMLSSEEEAFKERIKTLVRKEI